MKEALFYQKGASHQVRCGLCHHDCVLNKNKIGLCRVRQNIDGKLYSLNYGKIIANQIDPIEKKPLFHFLPGTNTYSLASLGCNFHCRHCQNSDISQVTDDNFRANDSLPEIKPRQIVAAAQDNACPSISYTYTEPTIFVEFAYECMRLAQSKWLKNIWVSNGYMSKNCLETISNYLDAINVDLKFFSDENYQKICGARLQPILDNLIWLVEHQIHLEVTTLIIPTLNDSDNELKKIAEFIARHLGREIPWHVSAFHPDYQLTELPPTPTPTIRRAQTIGREAGLNYVYSGNT